MSNTVNDGAAGYDTRGMTVPAAHRNLSSPARPGPEGPSPRVRPDEIMVIPVPALPRPVAAPPAAGTARPGAEVRPVHIPAPRPPSDRVVRAEARPEISIPQPRVPSDLARPAGPGRAAGSGRHRAVGTSRGATVLLVAGRLGSLATLAALLVVSAAVAGVVDGSAPTGPAAQVATTTLR